MDGRRVQRIDCLEAYEARRKSASEAESWLSAVIELDTDVQLAYILIYLAHIIVVYCLYSDRGRKVLGHSRTIAFIESKGDRRSYGIWLLGTVWLRGEM